MLIQQLDMSKQKNKRECASTVIFLQVTVWVVQQVSHSEKGMIEDTGWNSPVLSTDKKHALQQRHKLSPVSLLCLHITGIGTQNQVHLIEQKQ